MCKCAKSFSLWGLRPQTIYRDLPLDPTGGLSSSVYSRPLGEFSPPAQKNQKSLKNKFDKTEEPDARIHGWMTLTKNWSRFAFTI